jgi:hypothetical protein
VPVFKRCTPAGVVALLRHTIGLSCHKKLNCMRFFLLLCFLGKLAFAQQNIQSPDGKLKLDFSLNSKGEPVYTLKFKDQTIIFPSTLGFKLLNDTVSLKDGFEVVKHKVSSQDSKWTPVLGQYKEIRDHFNELEVELYQKKRATQVHLKFRLYDEGLAFRYEFPRQANLQYFIVQDELTQFNIEGDPLAFWLPGDYNTEEYRTTTSKLSEIPAILASGRLTAGESYPLFQNKGIKAVQAPLLLKNEKGIYIHFHEAALVNYPAMSLELTEKGFISHLTPDAVGNKAYLQTDFVTPWRTVMVTDDARKIIASSMILNLNEPCALKETDWIKPVKYVGVWWEMFVKGSTWAYTDEQNTKLGITDYKTLKPNGKHGANTANVKKHIDFAAKHGLDQVLVEGWNEGWEDWYGLWKEDVFDFVTPYPDFDLPYLRDYAASKGVKLMMHHETSASATNYERRMDQAFQFMKDNGYNAVKTGYVGFPIPRGEFRSGQWMVNHYIRVAKTAAKYKIMVNSHEAVRPTGLSRTYPNWIAQESARGTEFESMGGSDPDHTTILPFTRFTGGAMDYTPGIFQTTFDYYNPNNDQRVHTTLVKQLALYVVLYSPLQMAADIIENYERFSDAFQFIKDVAVDWDDTYVLEAEPGDYLSVGRKAKGKQEWFIGAITDENSRNANLNLNFLPKGKKFTATIYEDAPGAHWEKDPMKYRIRKVQVDASTVLNIPLGPGGGTAITIRQ